MITRSLDCFHLALELTLLPLIFFLPGYFLVNLLFPRVGSLGGSMDPLYRIFFGILTSIAITIIYGNVLVMLVKGSGEVLFLPGNLWPGLGGLTVVLFALGVYRGAYPRLRRWLGLTVPRPAAEEENQAQTLDRLLSVSARLEEARRRLGSLRDDDEEAADLKGRVEQLEAEKRRLEEEALGQV